MGFLTCYSNQGTLNTAKSALLSFIQNFETHYPIGQLPDILRFIASVLNSRPNFPKYTEMSVLDHMLYQQKLLELLSLINLRELVLKCVMLLLLTNCKGGQSNYLPNFSNMIQLEIIFHFVMQVPEKKHCAGKQKYVQEVFIVKFHYDPTTSLCKHIYRTNHMLLMTCISDLRDY